MNSICVNPTNGSIALDLSLIPLVHAYLSGVSLDQCALDFNLNIEQVNDFLNRKEVKSFISTQLANQGYASKAKRIALLSEIVDEKLELAKENELPKSNKDLLEILKVLREEENDLHKLKGDLPDETGKSQYINIINTLKAD